GLVFVYMGPPELKPPLPRYECLEDLGEGETYVSELPVPGANVTGALIDFNWLQAFENAMDPVHATWLHYEHSGPQFDGVGTTGAPHSFYDPYAVSDKIEYFKTDHGVGYRQRYEVEQPDGSTVTRYWSPEVHVPNIILLPDFVNVIADGRHDCVLFDVPSDDTHHIAFMTARTTDPGRLARITNSIKQNGKQPWELTEEEHQRYPADFEAQGSQGPITQHSEETLATSDKGVVMLRRLLKQMVDDVEAGRTPQNIDSGDEAKPRRTTAGHFTEGAATAAARS
ncbi:aromatic ring-hydroxylating dioxygenase subunit alpha, partial [Streptomyces sp. NPDC127079]